MENLFAITPDMDEETKAELLEIQAEEQALARAAAEERAAALAAERQADAAAGEFSTGAPVATTTPETVTTPEIPEVTEATAPQTTPAEAPVTGQPQVDADLAEQLRAARARASTADGILKSQSQRLRELEALLAERTAAPPVKPEQQPAGPTDQELIDDLVGDSIAPETAKRLVTAMRERAQRAAEESVSRMRGELDPLRQSVDAAAKSARQSAHERYVAQLSDSKSGVPDYEEVTADPAFLAYLDERGLLATLQGHDAAFDAPRVIRILKDFKQTKTPAAPPAASPQANPSDAQRAAIAAQATPRAAATGSASSGQRTYTRSEADALYRRAESDDSLTGEQAQALFATVEKAEREGRVRG